jgi:hypothetical protein
MKSDYIVLTDADGLHVWQEQQNLKWYFHVVRDSEIVTASLGPFDSKVQALHRAIHEYLRT